jgi:hypothetical protein
MRARDRFRSRRGNSVIEFALTFTFLFPLFAGTFQFGYAFFQYNKLLNAVRAGARYASLETYDSASSTPSAQFARRVKNVVVYGDPDPPANAAPVAPNLRPENVDLIVTFARSVPDAVTVRLKNYRLDAAFGIITLNLPAVTFEYAGRYAPPV